MKPHIVKQGDYLTRLAATMGFDLNEVWNHPKNAELKARRPNYDILCPGDVLFVPDKAKEGLRFEPGAVNRYRARVPKVKLKLEFRSSDSRLANAEFTVEGDATPAKGTTDGEGKIELAASVFAQTIRVVFPALDKAFTVFVGHLDPVTELSGVKARLTHLRYLLPPPEDDDGYEGYDDWLAFAVRDFQRTQGLPVTGVMDDATRAALVAAHGS